MRRVLLDPVTVAKFGDLDEPLELCDESGRLLGLMVPGAETSGDAGKPYAPDFTDEEIRVLKNQTGGRTLAEIRKSLGRTA